MVQRKRILEVPDRELRRGRECDEWENLC